MNIDVTIQGKPTKRRGELIRLLTAFLRVHSIPGDYLTICTVENDPCTYDIALLEERK